MTTTYTVQQGDNLTKIAKAHNTTVDSLVSLNHIQNANLIKTGQILIFEEANQQAPQTSTRVDGNNTNTSINTNKNIKKQQAEMLMTDTFQKTTKEEVTNSINPLLYAAAGAGAYALAKDGYSGVKASMPYVKKGAKNVAEMSKKAKDIGIKNAKAVKLYVTQKAKNVSKKAAKLNNSAKETANSAKQSCHVAANKAKSAAKSAAKGLKVRGRYAKLVANTKYAPKIIKGAGRIAGPAAAVFCAYEVSSAYKKGGRDAAVDQALKTGSGLAIGWAGAKAGAAIGSFAGPVGTVVGGAIGGIAGYLLGEKLFS